MDNGDGRKIADQKWQKNRKVTIEEKYTDAQVLMYN